MTRRMWECPECGAELLTKSKVCPNCGMAIDPIPSIFADEPVPVEPPKEAV